MSEEKNCHKKSLRILPALLLALGITASGALIGQSLATLRDGARIVSVKGLAEKEVAADYVFWPLTLTASGNELAPAQEQMQDSQTKLTDFLTKAGLEENKDFRTSAWRVTDSRARDYSGNPTGDRYILEATLQVATDKVEKVTAAAKNLPQLLTQGVLVGGQSGLSYSFTNVNEFKPALIAEATAQARLAAEQFAKDSSAKVGGIFRATQGAINIRVRGQDYDDASQPAKIMRVVTTIDYRLE